MIELIESNIARQEFEQRVRSFTPVHAHDARLSDDRQLTVFPIRSGVAGVPGAHSNWPSTQAQRVLAAITMGLSSLGERLQLGRSGRQEVSPSDPEQESVPV